LRKELVKNKGQTRKLVTTEGFHHLKADINRLYISGLIVGVD
jgi:hypothetical protein